MNSKTVALSAVKIFYESSQDSIDLYGNIVLHVSPNEAFSVSFIHNRIKESFDLDIPVSFIKTIIKRLRRGKYVEYKRINDINLASVKTSDSGKTKKQEIHDEIRKLYREEGALLSSLNNFLGNRYNNEELKKHLNFFIQNNLYMATSIFDGSGGTESHVNNNSEVGDAIRNFFIKSENSDPENFERLKVILLGKIISSNIIARKMDRNLGIKDITVYIDTNIFLSMLEFDSEYINRSVLDTIHLIKQTGSKIKIFEHTKDEVCGVLRNFINRRNFYSKFVKVNSVYYSMKKKGYDNQMVMSLITNIEEKFNDYGISIEYDKKNEEISTHSDISSRLSELENRTDSSVDYDGKSFARIRELRNPSANDCYFIEKCEVILLTSDKKFAQISEDANKNSGTIPEVITDSQLTGILWLKNVSHAENTFVRSFLEQGIKLQIISKELWGDFLGKLKEEKENGILSQGDINEIVSRNETESILLNKGRAGFEEIFSEGNIQNIRKNKEYKNNRIAELEKTLEERQMEMEAVAEELSRHKENIENKCKNKAAKRINIYLATTISIFTVILISIWFGSIYFPTLGTFKYPALLILIPILISFEMRFKKPIVPPAMKRWIHCDWIKVRNEWENKKIAQCVAKEKPVSQN